MPITGRVEEKTSRSNTNVYWVAGVRTTAAPKRDRPGTGLENQETKRQIRKKGGSIRLWVKKIESARLCDQTGRAKMNTTSGGEQEGGRKQNGASPNEK